VIWHDTYFFREEKGFLLFQGRAARVLTARKGVVNLWAQSQIVAQSEGARLFDHTHSGGSFSFSCRAEGQSHARRHAQNNRNYSQIRFDFWPFVVYSLGMNNAYFISDGAGRVKIGTSTNVYRRLQELQVGHPETLTCLGITTYEEQYLHEIFSGDHIRGEWFNLTPRIETFIRKHCLPMSGQESCPSEPMIRKENMPGYIPDDQLATTMFRYRLV